MQRNAHIHGTGATIGEIINAAVEEACAAVADSYGGGGGGGGYVPVPSEPSRFIRLAYSHPGNEDGSSASSNGILLDDSLIDEETYYLCTYQIRVEDDSSNMLALAYTVTPFMVGRRNGADAGVGNLQGSLTLSGDYGYEKKIAKFASDIQANDEYFWLGEVYVEENQLKYYFAGMSDATPTSWRIEVQLVPFAPATRPTLAAGLE